MKHKKGVIGIYWVVTAAIGLVILLFMIYLVRAGVGGGITEMFRVKEEFTNDIEKERMLCENLCNQAISRAYQPPPIGNSQWRATGYCSRSSSIDLNGDGDISAVDGETGLKCWDPGISFVHCDTTLSDGAPVNQCDCFTHTGTQCSNDDECIAMGMTSCDLIKCECS